SLRLLLEVALKKNPDDRFSSARAFRDALADWAYQTRRRAGANEVAAIVLDVRNRITKEKQLAGKDPFGDGTAPTADAPATDLEIHESLAEFPLPDTQLEPALLSPSPWKGEGKGGAGAVTDPWISWAEMDLEPETLAVEPAKITELLT